MAIVQISQIQVRRGLNQDLPQLASGEMGWSLDTRQLYIGNGTTAEGAPSVGVTEILTEFSSLLNVGTAYTFKGTYSGITIQTGPDPLHPVVRSLQDKLDDVVSVKDFGAKGDGITDDTAAITRALNRIFTTAQTSNQQTHFRTLNFPAGAYNITSTLNIPPFTRIQGEGKRTTIIQGSFAGPLAQFVDSFGQSGFAFGEPNTNGVEPAIVEYHFNDLAFTQQVPTFDQPCVLIDGGWSSTFNRCMFNGLLVSTTADYGGSTSPSNPVYDIDRGSGIAAVYLRNNSNFQGNRNIVFLECDFMQQNYGVQLEYDNHGIIFNNCYFDRMYHYAVIGHEQTGSSGYYPFGISFDANYFRYSAAEGILCYPYVSQVSSMNNLYTAWGCMDGESTSPINNPSDIAQFPAIVFNADNNYSITDDFELDTANSSVPFVNDNHHNCYIVLQGRGVINGRKASGVGLTTALADSGSFTSVGVTNIPASYTNITINYTLTHNNSQRTGVISASSFSGAYTWNEEYSETGTSQFVFRINPSTGDVEYKTTTTGQTATLQYSLDNFNP
jgi:hypothetical protein